MRQVGIADFRHNGIRNEVMADVADGVPVIITKFKRPIAVIHPYDGKNNGKKLRSLPRIGKTEFTREEVLKIKFALEISELWLDPQDERFSEDHEVLVEAMALIESRLVSAP